MSIRLDALHAAQNHHEQHAKTETARDTLQGVVQYSQVRVPATPEEVVATAQVFFDFLVKSDQPEPVKPQINVTIYDQPNLSGGHISAAARGRAMN